MALYLAALAATEAQDTAAGVGNVSWSATLAATEAADLFKAVGARRAPAWDPFMVYEE